MSMWEIIRSTGCLVAGESLIFRSLMSVYAGSNGLYELFTDPADGRSKAKVSVMAVLCFCAALIISKLLFEASFLFLELATMPISLMG